MSKSRLILLVAIILLSLILVSGVLAAAKGSDARQDAPSEPLRLLSEQTGLEAVSQVGGPGCEYAAGYDVYLCPAEAPAALPRSTPAARQQAMDAWAEHGLLIIPESDNDRVMAFDALTGDLVDADFIPADPAHLSTPVNAIFSTYRGSFLVSDQVFDAVYEYDLDGNFLRLFAPASGIDPAIMGNIRGIAYSPDGYLLVTVAEGANADSVIAFYSDGYYSHQYIPAGSGGLDSPFEIYQRSADWLVGGIDSDAIHRYDLSNATYLGDLSAIDTFPEQIAQAGNGNVLVANFSGVQEGIFELTPAGGLVGVYDYDPALANGYRGVYELPNGNLLVSTAGGVFEISRAGVLVSTKISGVSARYIEYLPPLADLEVTATTHEDPVYLGGALGFGSEVTNRGPLTATNVIFTTTLPIYPPSSGVRVAEEDTEYECSLVGTRDFVCIIDELGPGENFSIGFGLYTPDNAGGFGLRAAATSDQFDFDTDNNRDSTQVLVITDFEAHDCGMAFNPIGNCSFETGDFTGWITETVPGPFYPLTITDTGFTPWFGFFTSQPTEGGLALVHGFDGAGPGQYALAQDLYLPPNSGDLRFDYRLAWDLITFAPEDTLGRDFRVEVQPFGGGAALQETMVFSATAGTWYNDTGNLTGRVDVSSFAGQPVRLKFIWSVPQINTGPAFFQLDNIDITRPSVGYSPAVLESAQPPDRVVEKALTLYNVADGVMDWSLHEELLLRSMRLAAEAEALAAPAPGPLAPPDPASAADVVSDTLPPVLQLPQQPSFPANTAYPGVRQDVNAEPPPAAGALQLPDRVDAPITLYDNGPMITHPGGGSGGADASAVQSDLLMTLYGYGNQLKANNRLADDFTVPPGAVWNVTEVVFAAYQAGSGTASTITSVNYRIWDGVPGAAGSHVIWGNTYDNRLLGSTWSNIYRTFDTDLTSTYRPIMLNSASAGFHLPPGTYWIDWQADGTLASGPWVPPVTVLGQTTTGDALQSVSGGAWNPVRDSGTSAPQGLPFLLIGYEACVLGDHPNIALPVPSGSVPSYSYADVPVLFDSHGLSIGNSASGLLCLFTTDPLNAVLELPWYLDVTDYRVFLPELAR